MEGKSPFVKAEDGAERTIKKADFATTGSRSSGDFRADELLLSPSKRINAADLERTA